MLEIYDGAADVKHAVDLETLFVQDDVAHDVLFQLVRIAA